MVAAYETRLADARRESAGLRAALSQLEKEHRALVNEQVCFAALSTKLAHSCSRSGRWSCVSTLSKKNFKAVLR